MRLGDLTTLMNVYNWLGTSGYQQPQGGQVAQVSSVLQGLITRWSQAILSELERPWILPKTYVNEAYDGNGGDHQFLKNWPVTSLTQLAIGSRIIPPAPIVVGPPQPSSPGYGWRLEEWDGVPPGSPQEVSVVGIRYYMGKLNVQVTYDAGYLVPDEAQTVPAPTGDNTTSVVCVDAPYGIWAQDMGVNYSSGTPLTQTPGNIPPTAPGTYQVLPPDKGTLPNLSPPGQYVFYTGSGAGLPADDTNSEIEISYGYIPAALEQVTIELVCERYLYRGRIGEIRRTVAGQVTAQFDNSEWPAYAMPVLQRFKNVLPL
jgi:hypothetical protein